MPYIKRLLLLLVWLVPLLLPGQVHSQSPESSCPQIVQIALSMADILCEAMGTNRACYGHMLVDATPRPDVSALDFNQEGDIADVHALQAIRLSPMDLEIGTWGVALLNLQAYLQYAAPQEVTYVLFGDVEVTNAVEPVPTLLATVATRQYVNVRLGPTTNAGVIATLAPGAVVEARGRLADDSWLRVLLPDTGRVGWVYAPVLALEGDIETLQVMEAWSPYYGPMQAFYFRSGVDDSVCRESPQSGLLIQTPEGVGKITLLVNEVDIQLGSTVFFQAQPGEAMTIQVIEGSAQVTLFERTTTAVAGTQITIPIDDTLAPSGAPVGPAPYEMEHVAALPVELLERPVVVTPPLSEEEIEDVLDELDALSDGTDSSGEGEGDEEEGTVEGGDEEGSTPGTDPSPDEEEKTPPSNPGQDGSMPPGLIDNPGLGDSVPPGHNGSPPGQDKPKKK